MLETKRECGEGGKLQTELVSFAVPHVGPLIRPSFGFLAFFFFLKKNWTSLRSSILELRDYQPF